HGSHPGRRADGLGYADRPQRHQRRRIRRLRQQADQPEGVPRDREAPDRRRTQVMAQRILVVDDTPANVKLLGDLLRAKGYEVTTAANGEQALESIARRPPDLVLLDIMMPGLSGYDVCRRIRE